MANQHTPLNSKNSFCCLEEGLDISKYIIKKVNKEKNKINLGGLARKKIGQKNRQLLWRKKTKSLSEMWRKNISIL